MAERRMFTKKVTDDDNFMSLSASAQALYLHLSMSADDDGFCNQVSISMFKAHASVQDLQALLEKRYIYQFENGVIVIKHWRMANALRKDRYTPTAFQEELSKLGLKDNGSYTWLPDGCQEVATCLPQDRIGKDSIDKGSIDNIPPYIPPKGKEPKKQTAAELRKVFNSLVEESDLSDALKVKMYEWLDYKSQIKNQYKSPDGFSKLLTQVSKKALEFTDTEVIRVMDDTMAAGYKGIVWDWLNKQKQNTNTGSAYIDAIHNRLDVVDKWLKEGD
jgi:hypothetical protein